MLFVLLNPSGVSGYLFVEVPAFIGSVWGGCWNVLPEFLRLNVGAKNAPSLRRLNNLGWLGIVSIVGFSLGPLEIENVADGVFRTGFSFPSIVGWISTAFYVAGIFAVGIVAIVSRRIHYFVYPRPARRWSLRRVIGLSSFMALIAGLFLMELREFSFIGFVSFLGGSVALGIFRNVGKKQVMLSDGGGRTVSPPAKLATEAVGFDKRFALGKRISERILREHGKRTLAVCLWGPSGSEKEESVSYLDVVAIVKAGAWLPPAKKSVCEGIEVVVAYWDEASFMARAREYDENWPAYRSRFLELKVLYERDFWTRNLKPALEESDKADPRDGIRGEALDLVRHLGTLRDDVRSGDPDNIREECSRIADSVVNLVLLVNHKPYPVGDFWPSMLELPAKPADLRELYDSAKRHVLVDQQKMVDDTVRLGDEMLEMVRLRGISIEAQEPAV